MPTDRRTLGQHGEDLAVEYLRDHGYIILERNYRCPHGEVDIVCRDQERLAFVEVRTRRGTSYGTPLESVTPRKQTRLATVAREYLQERSWSDVDWGIDVVAIQLAGSGRLLRIELLRNAVIETP